MVISVVDRLKVYPHLEAAPKHALAVEGQLFRIHHAGEALVLHHLGIDAVALGARLVDDVGKEHRLAGFLLHRARERGALADAHVVGQALAELERAVLAPHLACRARHAALGRQVSLRHGRHEAINVRHGSLPPAGWRAPSRGSAGSAAPRSTRPAPAGSWRRSGSPRSGREPRSCRSRRGTPWSPRTDHRSPRPCRYARAP